MTVLTLVLLYFLLGWSTVCRAQNNSIRAGEALAYSEKLLVSANGKFQLGFFGLYTTSTERYLGIRYTRDEFDDKFWVSNPETPISATANASLVLDTNGALKIVSRRGDQILSIYDHQTASKSIATLEDSGNFILKELNPDGSVKRVLWESFDYPTNTLLPGMRLGTNFRTGRKLMLTSWLTSTDPSPGAFTLEYDYAEDGSRGVLVMRRRGKLYWKSGDYKSPVKNIRSILEDRNYKERFVSNVNGSYFSYSISRRRDSRLVLGPNGLLKASDDGRTGFIMVLENQCQGYSSQPGCFKQDTPKCRKLNDRFENRAGHFEYLNSDRPVSYDKNKNISLSDCWDMCWKSCTCVGFTIYSSNETGCVFWSKGIKFRQRYDGASVTSFLYASSLTFPTSVKQKRAKWWIWLIASSGGFCWLCIHT